MKKISHVLAACCLMLGGCCNEDFRMPEEEGPDYDFYEGALDITSLMHTCSEDAIYTTVGATPDLDAGDCWLNYPTPVANRWFKVKTTNTGQLWINVQVDFGQGTQRRTQVAIWDTDGTTQLSCQRAFDDNDSVYLYASDLTVGEYYYISVDVADTDSRGTFTICVSDTD